MRDTAVVTLKSERLVGSFDIEVPTDVPAGQLSGDIVEVINSYIGKTVFKERSYRLECERLERALKEDETFYEAGIWNGDVIVMVENGTERRRL